MAASVDIRFGLVLRQLLHERYRNKRKDFANSIHVSESALSQYVRGKATPSLHVLVEIARELDVSLDYLVFGIEPESPAPDFGGLVAHVEEAIARSQVKTATLRDFIGRVGAALAQDIETTASRVLAQNESVLGGGLTTNELLRVESMSKRVRIATVDLDPDVLLLSTEADAGEEGDEVAQTPVTSIVSVNVQRGCDYFYVIPEGPEWRRRARRLRETVGSSGGVSNAHVDRRVKFFESTRGLFPGYVIYDLELDRASLRDERLLDQIGDFVSDTGVVALAEPTSRHSRYYALIDVKHHRRLLADHDDMTRTCPRLVFD